MFSTVFTKFRPWHLLRGRNIKSAPSKFIYSIYNLRLSLHLRLGFLSSFRIHQLFSSQMHSTCPAHHISLYFTNPIMFFWGPQIMTPSTMQFSAVSLVSSLLRQYILFVALLWNALIRSSSFTASHQVQHQYKNRQVLKILNFRLLDKRHEDKGFWSDYLQPEDGESTFLWNIYFHWQDFTASQRTLEKKMAVLYSRSQGTFYQGRIWSSSNRSAGSVLQ